MRTPGRPRRNRSPFRLVTSVTAEGVTGQAAGVPSTYGAPTRCFRSCQLQTPAPRLSARP